MIKQTNKVLNILYFQKNVEAFREQLQQPDGFFKMILVNQKSCNFLLLAPEQEKDEERLYPLSHNIYCKKRIHNFKVLNNQCVKNNNFKVDQDDEVADQVTNEQHLMKREKKLKR